MAANNAYRAKGLECLSLAECMHDPEERAERLRFARMWISLANQIDEARGSYEFPREAEKSSNLTYNFLQMDFKKFTAMFKVSQCRHNSPACFIAWKVGRFNGPPHLPMPTPSGAATQTPAGRN